MTTLGGIILCGGRSQRMGQPKAWLPFGPELMLPRVARLLLEVVDEVVVVAATGQDLPSLPASIRVVRDSRSDRGPLQGLAAGLAALSPGLEMAYATATDVPFLEPRWMTRLVELMGGLDMAIPEVGGFLHPLAALYRRAIILPAVERLLADDRLRPVYLLELVQARRVGPEEMTGVDPALGTLRNLNTPEEYRQALEDAGFGGELD